MICDRCDSSDLIEGKLMNSDELVFLVSETKRQISKKASAVACVNCGHIHLIDFNPISVKICFCKEEIQ